MLLRDFMKTTISFELPEEREELNNALNGRLYKTRIDTLYNEVFRPHIKYEKPIIEDSLTGQEYEIIKAIWHKVAEHFEDVLE